MYIEALGLSQRKRQLVCTTVCVSARALPPPARSLRPPTHRARTMEERNEMKEETSRRRARSERLNRCDEGSRTPRYKRIYESTSQKTRGSSSAGPRRNSRSRPPSAEVRTPSAEVGRRSSPRQWGQKPRWDQEKEKELQGKLLKAITEAAEKKAETEV